MTRALLGTFLAQAVTIATIAAAGGQGAPPAAQPAGSADARARLDQAQRLAAELKYDAAIAAFEAVRAEQPDQVTALDGLKMVIVYAEMGNLGQRDALTRWLVERHRAPKTATDAERSVKGYLVTAGAKDPQLLAHAVEMTRYASERAAAHGEEQYQGFFDTSRGIALYRAGRYAEAAEWLPKTLDHQSLYVRSLALPFYAMTERALGRDQHAGELLARARREAETLPPPGSAEYGVEWTDILITRMVMNEAEEVFKRAR